MTLSRIGLSVLAVAAVAAVAIALFPTAAMAQKPVLPAGGVVELAGDTREITPGSLVRIRGAGFASRTTRVDGEAPVESMQGVTVEVVVGEETRTAPVRLVSPEAIEAQLPFEISSSEFKVRVRNIDGVTEADTVTVSVAAPRLHTRTSLGRTDVVAFHQDGRPVNGEAPAAPGENISLVAGGLGAVEPALQTGTPAPGDPLSLAVNAVTVRIGHVEAPVSFAGLMPGSVGVYQINVQVPSGIATGIHAVTVESAGVRSLPGVTIPVSNPDFKPNQFYVSPAGTPGGDGSRANPWDLATALRQPAALKPGDTIWLLGGDYGDRKDRFESTLAGEPGRPILVRQAPGVRATVQGGLTIRGNDTWYWGFEVTNDQLKDRNTENGNFGIDVFGPRTKLINLVIHDTILGVGFWTPAEDAEATGNIVYHNGFKGPSRGHGHGFYTQNKDGVKLLHDNVIFNQYGFGIQAYGSEAAFVENFDMRGNILFNNGIAAGLLGRVDNLHFSGGKHVNGIRVEENYTYHSPAEGSGYNRFLNSDQDPGVTTAGSIRNNYFVGGQFNEISFWDKLTFTGNTIYTTAIQAILNKRAEQPYSRLVWDNNTYHGQQVFYIQGRSNPVSQWRQVTALDPNSRFVDGRPQGVWSFVRGSRFEPGRANIVIYNWAGRNTVSVDVSKAIARGTRYELRDVQDFFGSPVLSGTYDGGILDIPMTGSNVSKITGEVVPFQPRHTLPEFGAFVLIPVAP